MIEEMARRLDGGLQKLIQASVEVDQMQARYFLYAYLEDLPPRWT